MNSNFFKAETFTRDIGFADNSNKDDGRGHGDSRPKHKENYDGNHSNRIINRKLENDGVNDEFKDGRNSKGETEFKLKWPKMDGEEDSEFDSYWRE